MWYYDGKVIKTPKAMVISGITHPAAIFTNCNTRNKNLQRSCA